MDLFRKKHNFKLTIADAMLLVIAATNNLNPDKKLTVNADELHRVAQYLTDVCAMATKGQRVPEFGKKKTPNKGG